MIRFLIVLCLSFGGIAQAKPRSVVNGGQTNVKPYQNIIKTAYTKPNVVNPVYNELKSIPDTALIPAILNMPRELKLQTLCLSMAIYREARGENYTNRLIVAQISVKRVGVPEFAPTLCDVIYQVNNYHGRIVAQYSWTIQPIRHQIKEPDAWVESQQLAYKVLTEHNIKLICPHLYFSSCHMMNDRMRDVKGRRS